MESVIKIEELGKLYQLGTIGTGTLSRDMEKWWARMRGKEDPFLKLGEINDRTKIQNENFVWALKDVSFDVKRGEVLGVIGRNGAGKSTLLKLLSKVTKPTYGRIKIKGRIASLLEVGTGFHPELTGRENVFLNGAIMGMTKLEIQSKFDQIVEFAGVERYINTPVKRYSSGMYVRLAFAVAAFLEPEVLIIDEVLAVGDAEFQKKCLGRMKEVSKNDGRTILFVSHNLGSIQSLCTKAVWLDKGTLKQLGTASDVIRDYNQHTLGSTGEFLLNKESSSKPLWIQRIFMTDEFNQRKSIFLHDEDILIHYEIGNNLAWKDNPYNLFCTILDENGQRVFSAESEVLTNNTIVLRIKGNQLVRGNYSLETFIHKPMVIQIDKLQDVCMFNIVDNGSLLNIHGDYNYGKVFGRFTWTK